MEAFISNILGKIGVLAVIGIMVFVVLFRYSNTIFNWIEDRTFKKREYILAKLKLLFIDFDPVKITYLLLISAFGPSLIILMFLTLMGQFFGGLLLATVFFVIGWNIPLPIINFMVHKKNKEYQNQMVDGLQLLGNALRAGQSLPQGLGMVVDELPAPISQEFNYILQQNKIGVPLEECMDELVKRVPIQDNEMFVTSINILHETGGNLPETFNTIVDIIRERIRVQQKIDTFVAQGLMQGMTIFCMPFVVGFLYYLSDPESMTKLFSHPLGWVAVIAALILDLIGGFFIYKIVSIKV